MRSGVSDRRTEHEAGNCGGDGYTARQGRYMARFDTLVRSQLLLQQQRETIPTVGNGYGPPFTGGTTVAIPHRSGLGGVVRIVGAAR